MRLPLLLAALFAFAVAPARAFDGPYFQAIWEGQNYKSAPQSAGTLLTMRGGFDGLSLRKSIIWHKSDAANTLIPQALQNIGVKPFGWSLLDLGGSAGNGAANITAGSGLNLAPSLLGPLAQVLEQSSSSLAKGVGGLIAGDTSGAGLDLGYVWNANPVQSGTIMPLNRWGSHLDAFVGINYIFP